jgi:hypothetical protein
MLEDREAFETHGGRFPSSPEELRLRTRFPKTGLYRADDPKVPLWTIDWAFRKESIVAMFEEYGHHFLVVRDAGGELEDLAFLEDGRIMHTYPRTGWVERKWTLPYSSCGFDYEAEVRYSKSAGRHLVVASSREGEEYTYDAMTGLLIGSTKRPVGGTVEPADAERKLSEELANFMDTAPVEQPDQILRQWRYFFASSVITQCSEPVSQSVADEQEEEAGLRDEVVPAFQYRAAGADLAGYQRVAHTNSEKFDMYRVPHGRAANFMCGEPADSDERASIQQQWLDVVGVRPAVATVLRMEITDASEQATDYDDTDKATVVLLWVRDAEWKISGIGFSMELEGE